MSHHALRGRTLRCRNAPTCRGGSNEALTGAVSALWPQLLRAPHCLAAGGAHGLTIDLVLAEVTVRRGIFDPHLRPVALQFLGDYHRQCGHAALAHLRALIANHNGVVRIDRDPGVDFVRRISVVVVPGLRRDRRSAGAARRSANADHEAASGGGGGEYEVTAAESRSDAASVHRGLP